MSSVGLALALALSIGAAPAGEPGAVLEPGQERAAAELVDLDRPDLGAGWRLLSVAVARDHVSIRLTGPAGPLEAQLFAQAAAPAGSIATAAGALVLPSAAPPALAEALGRRLSRTDPAPTPLRWRVMWARFDQAQAAREAATLQARVAARLAGRPAAALGGAGPEAATEPAAAARTRRLRAAGRPAEAAGVLWQGLAARADDAEALALAQRWGWGGQPRSDDAPSEPAGRWLLLAAALLLAAGWLGRRPGPGLAPALVTLAVAAAALMWLAVTGARAPTEPPPLPTPSADLLSLGRAGPCAVAPPLVTEALWQTRVRCGGELLRVTVRGGTEGRAWAATAHHRIEVAPLGGPRTPSTQHARWLEGLRREVARREGAGLRLAPAASAAEARGIAAELRRRSPEEATRLTLAAPVVVLALLGLLSLLLLAGRDLWRAARGTPGGAPLALGLLGFGAVAHALAPTRLVMVYTGYTQTHALAAFEPLRYGAGANWLYGPLLHAFGLDHATVQAANGALGLLTVIALAALTRRLVPERPSAPAIVAFLAFTAPLLWRDHASESVLVGGALLFVAALYGLAEAARSRHTWPLLPATACAAAAGLTRPELGLVLLPAAAVVLLHIRPRAPRRWWLALGLLGAAATTVAVVHLGHLRATVDALTATDALPGLDHLADSVVEGLTSLTGLRVAWAYGPALLVPLLAAALLARGARVLTVGLVLVTLLWTGFTRVDLPEVSIPRVHAPPWLLLAVVGALGAHALIALAAARGRLAEYGVAGLVAAGWLVSAGLTLPTLYAPTNADVEEALIRASLAQLPTDAPSCLATLGYDDPPAAGKTHRFFPGYLLRDRRAPVRLERLGDIDPDRPACRGGTYALLGMRCYMHLREGDAAGPPPPGAPLVAGCRQARERWALDPLLRWDAPNQGDVAFPMYPAGRQLAVGLYRVLSSAASPPTR